MPKRPELVIYYDADSFPIAATCSVCKEEMQPVDKGITTSHGALGWFAGLFKVHVQSLHPDTDPQQ